MNEVQISWPWNLEAGQWLVCWKISYNVGDGECCVTLWDH